ncbi:MAG TPA: carboxypeptidase-like regulatory domain-containing protein [Thermoplasmata archaeon]|nr:carboxypeptidase-like regulatory domain-containing protein [Thermoplasmata archaeon]
MGKSMRLASPLLVLALLAPALLPANIPATSDLPTDMQARPVKDKVFYLQTSDVAKNIGTISTRNFLATTQGVNGQEIQSQQRIIAEWYLYPELAGEVKLNGTATLILWYRSTNAGGTPSWDLFFDRVSWNGTLTSLATLGGVSVTPDTTTYEEKTLTFPVDTTANPLLAGESLRLRLNIRGNAATDYFLAWGNATYDSRLVLPTEDYLRVVPATESGIYATDSQFVPRANFLLTAADRDIYLFAPVTNPFGGYDIASVNLTVRDPGGAVIPALDDVPMARISGFFNSFTSVYRVPWNYSGWPVGVYNLTVTAVDRTGAYEFAATASYGVHQEVGTGQFSLGAPPLAVWVRVVALAGANVSGALVEARVGGVASDSGVTGAAGLVLLNLFNATHEFVVLWTGVVVASQGVAVSANVPASSPLVLTAAIVSPTLRVVDVATVPLAQAALFLRHPNGTVDVNPRLTDADGRVNLTLVAGGTYGVTVLWRGKTVVQTTVDITADAQYTLAAAVYYVLFTANDQTSLPVPDAFLTVSDPVYALLLDSQVTDDQGRATSRLPAGDFTASATYFGRPVYGPAALNVSGNLTLTLSLQVFDATWTIYDSRNATLEGATVTVTASALSRVANTGADGRVSFKLPQGAYTLLVLWRGVEVLNQSGWIVDSGGYTFSIGVRVFYLTVRTVDRDGRALVGTYVTASAGNQVWGADFTGPDGEAEFRLPAQNYTLDADYRTTIGFSNVDFRTSGDAVLDAERVVELRFSKLPLSLFEQLLTWVLLFFLLLILLLAYLAWRRQKRQAKEEDVPVKEEAREEPEEDAEAVEKPAVEEAEGEREAKEEVET